MSAMMDLTGIFKPVAGANTTMSTGTVLNKENLGPQQLYGAANCDNSSEDVVEWVHARLEVLDLPVKSAELTPNVTRCIQQLLMERENLREKCDELITNCAEVQARTEHGCQENELLENQVLILRQDLGLTQMQLEALQNEQREVKLRYLQEKAELEQRCFRLQALETQHQARVRKVENDFGKLQDQLHKQTRPTDRKSASIQMSAAAANNRTRATANVFIAERKEQLSVAALRDANSMILEENEKLRDLLGSIVEDFDALNERADRLEEQLHDNPTSPTGTPKVDDANDTIVAPSPMVELVNPRNKPLNWLRQHLDSNMFKLRQRILAKAHPPKGVNIMTPSVGIQELDPTLSRMQSLTKRLRQAEQVVDAQDKLITAALLCKLPVSPDDASNNDQEVDEEIQWASKEQRDIIDTKRRLDMELEYLEEQKTRLKLASRNLSASASAKKAALAKQYNLEDLASTRQQLGSMFDSPARDSKSSRLSFSDLLPPATPGTMAALRNAGLPLPSMSSADGELGC